jgi:cephalosporin-C deacetylase
MPTTDLPDDFDSYWADVEKNLGQNPARPDLEPLPWRSTMTFTVYALKLTSAGPYRIFGYYSVPAGNGPFPGLLRTPRYGSVNHVPDYEDRQRYAVLQLMHRGQRLADQPFAASYPGLLTLGIHNPHTYVYRDIVADCLRGAEFLLSRAEVDVNCVGIVGDDLAVITTARRPGFTALLASGFMFYRLMEACARTSAYPIEEINDHLRAHPEQRDAVTCTVAYMDPLHHAGRVRATTLLPIGDHGGTSGEPWLQPLIDAYGGSVERYQLTHEGGTDRDWQDAWLAGKLGAQPLSRFRRYVDRPTALD